MRNNERNNNYIKTFEAFTSEGGGALNEGVMEWPFDNLGKVKKMVDYLNKTEVIVNNEDEYDTNFIEQKSGKDVSDYIGGFWVADGGIGSFLTYDVKNGTVINPYMLIAMDVEATNPQYDLEPHPKVEEIIANGVEKYGIDRNMYIPKYNRRKLDIDDVLSKMLNKV